MSGGADSIAMLHCLLRFAEQGAVGAEFAVGHVNHGIRGAAADGDQRFVEETAGQRGLEVFCRTADVPGFAAERKLSLETAGRMLRIGMLAEIARQCGANAVATGHHKDDQAETMIFRLMRGTGFRGLCGIRPAGELEGMRFIRPLLGVGRGEIMAYCRRENLPWRQDHTNADCGMRRNYIRHKLLPYLQEQTKRDVVEELAVLSEKCRRLFARIHAEIEPKLPEMVQSEEEDTIVLKKAVLAGLSPIVLGEVLRRCLVHLEVGLRDYTAQHYQLMMECVQGEEKKRSLTPLFPGDIEGIADADTFSFRKKRGQEPFFPAEPVRLEVGTSVRFGPFEVSAVLIEPDAGSMERFQKEKTNWTERLDAGKIKGPIRIRRRRPGDRFRPLGMKADKKVGKFLTAAKASPQVKDKVFIVEDGEKILWTAPIRICEEAKVTTQTRRILQLIIQ